MFNIREIAVDRWNASMTVSYTHLVLLLLDFGAVAVRDTEDECAFKHGVFLSEACAAGRFGSLTFLFLVQLAVLVGPLAHLLQKGVVGGGGPPRSAEVSASIPSLGHRPRQQQNRQLGGGLQHPRVAQGTARPPPWPTASSPSVLSLSAQLPPGQSRVEVRLKRR